MITLISFTCNRPNNMPIKINAFRTKKKQARSHGRSGLLGDLEERVKRQTSDTYEAM